jgi:hypothetical protein
MDFTPKHDFYTAKLVIYDETATFTEKGTLSIEMMQSQMRFYAYAGTCMMCSKKSEKLIP